MEGSECREFRVKGLTGGVYGRVQGAQHLGVRDLFLGMCGWVVGVEISLVGC